MSLATYASPYNNDNNNNISNEKKPKIKNKTIKRREPMSNRMNNPKLEAMIHSVNDIDNNTGDEELANFNPLDPPEMASLSNNDNNSDNSDNNGGNYTQENEGFSSEQFSQLPGEYAKQYYQQYVPYYNQMSGNNSTNGDNKDELLTKLNQLIFLLEEQQEEKTGNVTEELILYSFLGVFIIFIVDSFARVGKYVR